MRRKDCWRWRDRCVPVAALVLLERAHQVSLVLPAESWYAVNLRKGRAPAFDAVEPSRICVFSRPLTGSLIDAGASAAAAAFAGAAGAGAGARSFLRYRCGRQHHQRDKGAMSDHRQFMRFECAQAPFAWDPAQCCNWESLLGTSFHSSASGGAGLRSMMGFHNFDNSALSALNCC